METQLKEVMEKLCNMETKLAKLDDIDKRLDKIDDIQEKMKKLITANNINNGVLKSHGSQISTLESLSKTQTEEILDLKTKLFQTDNNKNFITTERNGNLIVRGLSAPSRNSQNSANSVIKTELVAKLCDSADEEQEILKWFDAEPIAFSNKSPQPSKCLYKLKFKNRGKIYEFKKRCSRLKGSQISVNDDLSKQQQEILSLLLKKKKELKEKMTRSSIYANRYLIVRTSSGEEYYESNGQQLMKIPLIPGLKPTNSHNSNPSS
ncbi:unnamed protein product [Allacma fusca]|uniref:Uncharacterized protein n=1 Tax=Allacma fusca TaxID=39272 RepID=A0A8J2JT50_9HEXA|nr:unnamed protein product [Allacma fusca]